MKAILIIVWTLIVSLQSVAQVIDKDGNTYKTVEIGNQEWMAENLNVSHFENGDPIPQAKTYKEWEKAGYDHKPMWCYFMFDPKNGKLYGRLYNFYAVSDPRKLAPNGWHIPSETEWTVLINFLGGKNVTGGKMKEAGTKHWGNPNTAATNESGFNGLPGSKLFSGFFDYSGQSGCWWTSTEADISFLKLANARSLSQFDGKVNDDGIAASAALSIRCIKD